MNDNSAYIVQCTRENFEDVRCLVQVFCGSVLEVDTKNYCIKTLSLDATMKQRLDDIGVSFWPEPDYAVTKSMRGGRRG